MNSRSQKIEEIAGAEFDVCVIGGGATGAGCALDAQLRGLRTVLVDAGDFASGTSSASTKLVHGGVRYLEQAVKSFDLSEYRMVQHALRERTYMLGNAPHLAHAAEFLVPVYSWLQGPAGGKEEPIPEQVSFEEGSAGAIARIEAGWVARNSGLCRWPVRRCAVWIGAGEIVR